MVFSSFAAVLGLVLVHEFSTTSALVFAPFNNSFIQLIRKTNILLNIEDPHLLAKGLNSGILSLHPPSYLYTSQLNPLTN